MKKFSDLTKDEVNEVINRANQWENKFQEHVNQLIKSDQAQCPPSGSDIFHPELWKPGHWRWFKHIHLKIDAQF